MIISRTPFRISFFGGGTDYPAWFRDHGGAVIGTTIDKYAYISCRYLPEFFDHSYRIVYSAIENCKTVDEIVHPSVRECIRHSGISQGLEIHHDADIPARSGIGSSSTFTVGLLHCLSALGGKFRTKAELAAEAIHVEQERIGEKVGSQDQVHAAYGGFNLVEFEPAGDFRVTPLALDAKTSGRLNDHLLLFFTGLSRNAHDIAAEQIRKTPERTTELNKIRGLVTDALDVLRGGANRLEEFGELLHESWMVKRSMTDRISTGRIDEIYELGRGAGALGGKLLGAGGGGFMLFFAKPESHSRIIGALGDLVHVPFRFDDQGTRIIFANDA